MGALKFPHSSGNSTSISSPAANPSASIELKLPSTTGSAGDALKVASANHSSTNAELEWGAVAPTTTSGTDNFTVADGNLVIGTAGHGIDFSAVSSTGSMTSELLDWYEEGTWTPAFTGTTWSSFTTQTGTYTRCGAIVVAHGWIVADTSNQSGNGGTIVSGLPYQMSYNSASNRGAVTFGYSKNLDLTGDKRQLTGTIIHNGNSFSVHNLEDNGSPFTNYEHNMTGTVELSFTAVYTTGVN